MNKGKRAPAAGPRKASNGQVRSHNERNGARENEANGREKEILRAVRADRNELEEAIRSYANLYEFAPVGYVTFDRAGRIEQANIAACELLRAKRESLIGAPFSLWVIPEDLSLLLAHLVRCRHGQPRVETTLHLKRGRYEAASVLLSSTSTSDVRDGAQVFQTAIVDLTERERAEAAVRAKEAELELIVTQTPFMLTRCTRDLRFRYVSNAYAKMVGLTAEEIAGKPIVEIVGKESLAKIRPHIERVLAGETVSFEAVVPFEKKKSRILHAVYVPDRDTRGDVVGWIGSIIDISERKKNEAAAMRLAAVVQSSHDAIVAKDLNGIITDWNHSAERIFGYKAKEIIGKSILTLIPKERHKEEDKILRTIRSGRWINHYETVRRRKDGKLIDVSLTISPVRDREGKIIGVSKIARDITPQKNTERRLAEQARLLDLTNDAVIVRDMMGRIAYWNHGAKELYGYTAKEALGKITHNLLHTEHPDSLENIKRKLRQDDRWAGELVHQRKDGSKVYVMSRWSLDRDSKGQPAAILETNTDITARKQAEFTLKRSKDLLERMVAQRTKALRDANSELENEINRRKGLEGQILEISDREQERLGQELHDGICQRLTAIAFMTRAAALRLKDHRVADPTELDKIAQLINASVTDARNIARDLHKEEIDAAGLEDALRSLAERKIWKTPCRIQFDGDITVEDDRTACEIFRILREGVINANKHARATEIILEARRRKRELVFSVTDNGVGLNGNVGHGRSGLGMHIMHYRAKTIGAQLELENPRRGGTRLTIRLPLSK
jgi:PAS domain S-box-containing protein